MQAGEPLVSVVIPCYNTERFVLEAIESVRAQTYRSFDITVVDDGSTDESALRVERVPGVRLIRQANRGVCAARNRGMSESAGEFLVFLDADDRLLPDALRIGVDALAARPEHGFVFGFSRSIGLGGDVRVDRHIEPYADPSFVSFLAGRSMVPPAVAMIRRSAAEAVGGFRVGMPLAEDHDFYLRVTRRFPVYCHNRVVAEYRSHVDNACKQSTVRLFLGVLDAMNHQLDYIRGKPELEAAHKHGRRHWAHVFGRSMSFEFLRMLRRGRPLEAARIAGIVARHYPQGFWEIARFHLERITRRRKKPRTG